MGRDRDEARPGGTLIVALRFAEPAAAAHDYQLTIGTLLRTAIDTRSAQEIVGSDGRRHGYAELERRIGALASALDARGVGQGDVVAGHGLGQPSLPRGLFRRADDGRRPPDGERPPLVRADRIYAAFHRRADAAVPCRFRRSRRAAGGAAAAARGPHPAARRASETPPVATDPDYETLLAQAPGAFAFAEFDERAIATTFHTTGTTGLPKAVAFSHRQLVLHTLACATTLANQPTGEGLRRGDVYMPITPMFHVHAWGLPYVATMLGLKQVYPGRYLPERLVALHEREGVTFSHGVPTILRMIVDALGQRKVDRWTMIVGGSALPAALVEAAEARGITAVAGYGMSETAPVVSIARHDPGDPRSPADTRRRRAGRSRSSRSGSSTRRCATPHPASKARSCSARPGSPPAMPATPPPRKACGRAGGCIPRMSRASRPRAT